MLKNEKKIRKLLDYKKYHLCTTSEGEWILFGNKDTSFYFSEFNKPIMSNKTHTEKDLLKFAKEHHCYDEWLAGSRFRIILSFIPITLALLNIKFKNPMISMIIFSIDFVLITECIFNSIIISHNFKIEDKEFEEDIKRLRENATQIDFK